MEGRLKPYLPSSQGTVTTPADDPDQPDSTETEIFSKMHARLWIIPDARLVASTLLATMVVTGCGENPNNSDGLDEISVRYRSTLRERPVFFGGDETPPETAKELRTLARQATQVSTSPAHLLSAGIHAKAGAFELNDAMAMQSKSNLLMENMGRLIDATELLAATADMHGSFDNGETREFLAQRRMNANGKLAEAQGRLDDLQDPIEKAKAERAARRERASQLESKAAKLAIEGIDAGPLDGHDTIQESIALRKQAKSQRIAAARNEIELANLEPQRALALHNIEGEQGLISAAQNSEQTSEKVRSSALSWAEEVRAEVAQSSEAMNAMLAGMNTEQEDVIRPLFQAAIDDFNSASQSARQATRGGSQGETNAAWLAVASSELSRGRVQWVMAGNFEQEAALLARLYSAGDLFGNQSDWEDRLEKTLKNRDASVKSAETSFQDALKSLGQARGRNLDTSDLQAQIESAIQVIQGADLISMADARRSESTTAKKNSSRTRRSSGGGSSTGDLTPGFATPEAAVQSMANPPSDWPELARLLKSTRGNTPAARSISGLLNDLINAMDPFVNACMAKFGSLGTEDPFGELKQMVPTGTPSIKSVSGNTAIIDDGEGTEMHLIKDGNRWYVDLDQTMGEDQETMQMMQMVGMMATPVINQMAQVSKKIARNIDDGKYATADEATTALSDQMSEIIGNMLGGMMGGAGGGGGGGGFGGFGGFGG